MRGGEGDTLQHLVHPQRRSDKVDLCELNNLGASLIDFCISTGKCFWLSLRRAPLFKSRLGPVVEKAKAALSCIIQNQLAMTRGILFHKGQPRPTSSGLWGTDVYGNS